MEVEIEAGAAARKIALCDQDPEMVAFVRGVFGRLGEKWPIRALDCLADGPSRFTALQEAMPGISHRVLTVTLRALKSDGLVSRTAWAEVPPRVEYALTPLGDDFLARLLELVGWLQAHQGEIEASREAAARSAPAPAGASRTS